MDGNDRPARQKADGWSRFKMDGIGGQIYERTDGLLTIGPG